MSTKNMFKFCPFCGSKIVPNAKFCMECGKELPVLNIDNVDNKSENALSNIEKKDNQEIILNQDESRKNEPKKIKKSFSVLNNKSKNNINKENSGYDLIRPNTVSNSNNEFQISNDKVQYSKNVGEINTVSANSNVLSCPSCGNQMQLTQTSGLLSKGTYHHCNKCFLKFKEDNNFLILVEEPEFTRMRNKLHLKRYSIEQWKGIIHGDYSPDFSNEFSKWQFDSPTSLSCPACNHSLVRYSSSGFGSKNYLICTGCALVLEEHKNNQYSLHECIENYSPLWRYVKNKLTLEEMEKIIHSNESEENRLFREKKVKEHELAVKQHQIKVQRQERKVKERQRKVKQQQKMDKQYSKEALTLFNKSLENGEPLLPAPSDTTIVLKKNEVPVYKLYNVTLSEPRSVRTSSGGYGGASVRIAKGITLHSGRTASTSQSHDEIKVIDSGNLLITNKRIIFLGSNRTLNIDMNKIVSITSGGSMIQIQRSNKQKPEYFKNIHATEYVQVEGRQYPVTITGEIIRKLIIGLI